MVESIDAHANVDKYADADFFNGTFADILDRIPVKLTPIPLDFEDDFDDEDLKIPFEDLKQKQ